ncbi:MAG: FkbM family methyltransferase [Bacteroidota bacterium]|nr:FkbM family methyltransferase [Bacteroidota bacterium]
MKLTRIAVKLITYVYFLFKYRSHSIASIFAQNNLLLKTTSITHRNGKNLQFTGNAKNSFPLQSLKDFNHQQLSFLIALLNKNNIFIVDTGKGYIVLRIDDIDYRVVSGPNLAIMHELFIDNNYGISTGKEYILLDIGMNVGYASLYFSSFKNIKRIYSYEPFTDTFNIARQNINANDLSAKKIKAHNYGISNYTGTVNVPLPEEGSVIASTEESFIKKHNFDPSKSIRVNVRDILEVLKEVREENPGEYLALKIDCEGEEYNILESLDKNDSFDKIIFLCVEWHFKGPDRIKEILIKKNYTVFDIPKTLQDDPGMNFGMIYAFKNPAL